MKPVLTKLLGRAGDLASTQPLLALSLGAALLIIFLSVIRPHPRRTDAPQNSMLWVLYDHAKRCIWAFALVALIASALSLTRDYLRQAVGNFQHDHGRVTAANYRAVQTIWGAEQVQRELRMELFYDEEITERIESEDLTKPTVLRKKTVRHFNTANPFVSARHEVSLRQNPRRKGSALYGGYETVCRFTWRLRNPADRELKGSLKFPLPAAGAMYDDLSATLNGKDILPDVELKDSMLSYARDLNPGEVLDLSIAFKSRGMSHWYFQVLESREIRGFTLLLNLPDLPEGRLNYPEGCMTPTEIKPTPDRQGSILTYRLDHAISSKGMGIVLPQLPQPGATTSAVLHEAETGWMLTFALLLLGMGLAGVHHVVPVTTLFGLASAFGYGLLAGFSDLLFGFWGTAGAVIIPFFLLLAWVLTRTVGGRTGRLLALQLLLYGLLYPTVAGLDDARQPLYFNLCALLFLAFTTWQLVKCFRSGAGAEDLFHQPTILTG